MSRENPNRDASSPASETVPDTVVLDLGGVLVRWDPAAAVAGLLTPAQWTAAAAALDFPALNAAADRGRSYTEIRADVAARFAGRPALVAAFEHYHAHVGLSFPGPVPGTGRIVEELDAAGIALFGLTNWSAETVAHALRAAPVIERFTDIVVSGREGVTKPDPRLFEILLQRHGLDPARCVYVDDAPANVAAAARLGMVALHFTEADRLRADLAALGVLHGGVGHGGVEHGDESAVESGARPGVGPMTDDGGPGAGLPGDRGAGPRT